VTDESRCLKIEKVYDVNGIKRASGEEKCQGGFLIDKKKKSSLRVNKRSPRLIFFFSSSSSETRFRHDNDCHTKVITGVGVPGIS
jgi:hypothetical protein